MIDISVVSIGSFYILMFILGTIVGSFINVIIYRLHRNIKGILWGRSFCPYCKHELSAPDLIPLLSFLFLQGKCRYCRKPISWSYPLVETMTGIVFVYLFHTALLSPSFSFWQVVTYFFYGATLVIISFYDLYHYEIPDIVIKPAIVIAALLTIVATLIPLFAPPLNTTLIGVTIALIFLGGQVWISHETWMGIGDVYIGVFMGLILGWQLTIVALFFAYIIGSVIGIILVLLSKKTGKSQIPFGPFLSMGTLLALGIGNEVLQWYLSLLS